MKAGDLIFCYSSGALCSIATAVTDAYYSARPPSRNFKTWAKEGRRVDIKTTQPKELVKIKDIAPSYYERFNLRSSQKVITTAGRAAQIYMAKIPADAAQYLLELTASIGDYEDNFADADLDCVSLKRTMREAIKMARIGQGKFRANLIERWGGRCALTGLKNSNLLIASHIEPWSLSSNHSRLDTDNGLLLAVHIDKLFDCGLISFTDNGTLLTKQCLTAQDRSILGLKSDAGLRKITKGNAKYLNRHRELHNFHDQLKSSEKPYIQRPE